MMVLHLSRGVRVQLGGSWGYNSEKWKKIDWFHVCTVHHQLGWSLYFGIFNFTLGLQVDPWRKK